MIVRKNLGRQSDFILKDYTDLASKIVKKRVNVLRRVFGIYGMYLRYSLGHRDPDMSW